MKKIYMMFKNQYLTFYPSTKKTKENQDTVLITNASQFNKGIWLVYLPLMIMYGFLIYNLVFILGNSFLTTFILAIYLALSHTFVQFLLIFNLKKHVSHLEHEKYWLILLVHGLGALILGLIITVPIYLF